MRTSKQVVDEEVEVQISRLLPDLLSDLGEPEEIMRFFRIFFSVKEFEIFSKRLAVMYSLHKGKKYAEIKNEIKVSSATIATAQEIIEKNNLEGFFKILDANEWAQKWADKLKVFVGK